MDPKTPGRDRLRELLDAALDDGHGDLTAMAGGAHASPFHYARLVRRDAGEPPVALRRRVLLERAAWELDGGATVRDAAATAGYDSADGFSRAFRRAFGRRPSARAARATGPGDRHAHWLPAPNGIHFHPPTSLWVEGRGDRSVAAVTALQVEHDVADTADLLALATGLPDAAWHRERVPGLAVHTWAGAEGSLAALLHAHVHTKAVWLAALEGGDHPTADAFPDPAALAARHEQVAPRWLALVRGIDRRGAWDDAVVDALCDPPESFLLGEVVAHVLTYAAHRRLLARHLLRDAGVDLDLDDADPIRWHRRTTT